MRASIGFNRKWPQAGKTLAMAAIVVGTSFARPAAATTTSEASASATGPSRAANAPNDQAPSASGRDEEAEPLAAIDATIWSGQGWQPLALPGQPSHIEFLTLSQPQEPKAARSASSSDSGGVVVCPCWTLADLQASINSTNLNHFACAHYPSPAPPFWLIQNLEPINGVEGGFAVLNDGPEGACFTRDRPLFFQLVSNAEAAMCAQIIIDHCAAVGDPYP